MNEINGREEGKSMENEIKRVGGQPNFKLLKISNNKREFHSIHKNRGREKIV